MCITLLRRSHNLSTNTVFGYQFLGGIGVNAYWDMGIWGYLENPICYY